ncbi:MAG: LytR/AlgR family response regulator transcription factor [Oceanihabitans sp.]
MISYFTIDKNDAITSKLENVLTDFTVFNSCGNGSYYEEAMNNILKTKPDLVFINLDNVLVNAFDLVRELSIYLKFPPSFIGVSTSKKFAYSALKYEFEDYLINPLTELEVRKSLLKFQRKLSPNSFKTLCLKSYKDYQYLDIDNILFLKADNNATDFYMRDGEVISAFKTLKVFEGVLPGNFLRIHKSYIVNTDYVSRINYGSQKCSVASLKQHKLPFTKTFINNIESIQESLLNVSLISQN